MLNRSSSLSSVPRLFRRNLRSPKFAELRTPTITQNANTNYACKLMVNNTQSSRRSFHVATPRRSLMPDAENPPPRESEPIKRSLEAAKLSDEEYHLHADEYLEVLVDKLEEMQETRPDLDVEYSAGVLNVDLASIGTYVINKQPPNKQIWLSSPVSGPNRFDWVIVGDTLQNKEETEEGDWISLRDGSSLTEVLRKEVGVNVTNDDEIA